jgi:hypothetical protein
MPLFAVTDNSTASLVRGQPLSMPAAVEQYVEHCGPAGLSKKRLVRQGQEFLSHDH